LHKKLRTDVIGFDLQKEEVFMKRLTVMVLALALCSMSVFAGTQQTTEGTTGGDNTPTTLSMGVFGDLESAYKAVFASEDFKAKFPNLTVELQPADFGGHHNRLVTQIAAGTGANDIEALEIGYIARFVADGGLTDLSKAPYNGNAMGKDLVKFGMSNASTSTGKLVAMPVDIAPAIMFWRKSIIDDAGVDLTNVANWEEYIEIGKKLTVDKDNDGVIDQYAVTHPTDLAMIPLNGGKGDWFKDDAPYEPKSRFTAVLDLVSAVRGSGIDANFTPWSGEWINGFKEDKVVTMFSGAWLGGHFKNWMCPELAGDWRVSYPPAKTFSSYGGSYLSIPDQTDEAKKLACWGIIAYLTTSEEAQLLTFETTDAFPALTTVFSAPIMDEPVEYFGGQKVRQIYQDIAKNIPVQNVSEYDAIALDIFNKSIGAVISDGVSVEQAYEEAKKEMLAQM
jgi:multiple sugar transport system substrate-binding protein